jgi:hypothetical protein
MITGIIIILFEKPSRDSLNFTIYIDILKAWVIENSNAN